MVGPRRRQSIYESSEGMEDLGFVFLRGFSAAAKVARSAYSIYRVVVLKEALTRQMRWWAVLVKPETRRQMKAYDVDPDLFL